MHRFDYETLVDDVYEAALIPERWPQLLHKLSDVVDGFGASIFTTDFRQVPRWIASPTMQQVFSDWISEKWIERSQRPRRLTQLQHAGFIAEQHVFTPGEKDNDDEFVNFLKPRKLGIGTGTFIPMPTADVVIYSIERKIDQPPITNEELSRLDMLRPHLARAGAIAVRLGLERARTAAETFDVIGLPAAALDASGRVLAGNRHFSKLVPDVFQDRQDRLHLRSAGADALFVKAISGSAFDLRKVKSIPIAQNNAETAPYVLHLLPMRGNANDIFQRTSWLAVAVPISPGEVPGAEILQALFDLTPAEARVARAVAQTLTLEKIAEKHGVSRETLKSQLRAIFNKTGTSRQGELIALLQGRIPAGTDAHIISNAE